MTRLRRTWQLAERLPRSARVALAGAGLVVAVAVIAVVLTAVTDNTPEVELEPRQPDTGPQVSWGKPEDGRPRGVVMLLHGGGWRASPEEYENQRDVIAPSLQEEGYATVAIGYDAGEEGFRQIEEVYAEARRRYPDLPICANGISAGGHLALVLATREPSLDCVIALSAPTNLTSLKEQAGADAHRDAVEAFGSDQLADFSPARHAEEIEADVLIIAAESDPVVPAKQAREFAKAMPEAELLLFPLGSVPAVWAHHGGVEPGAEQELIERQLDFLAEATQAS